MQEVALSDNPVKNLSDNPDESLPDNSDKNLSDNPDESLPDNPDKKWYAVHVLSGHERKVQSQLENEADIAGLSDKIFQILIPSEQITEMRDGKKRTRNKVFFPGYMLVEMVLDKETRHLILNTSGITSFVGPKNEPQALRQDEVDRILGKVEESGEGEVLDIPFTIGDPILVIDGPFTDFTGFVEEINEEKKKVKVRVSIFGRSTPVELDFLQVSPEK